MSKHDADYAEGHAIALGLLTALDDRSLTAAAPILAAALRWVQATPGDADALLSGFAGALERGLVSAA